MQKTTISTNRLKRALGLYKLSFTQANSNKKQQGNFNIVAINKKQVSELLEQFYPNIHTRISKNKPHKYLMYRLLYIGFFIVFMINIGLFFLPSVFLLVNILLVLLVIGNAWFSYRKCFYYVDKDYIVRGGGGLIDSWTSFLELHKTQSIQIKQSIFQKRRGLTSMIIHSASRSMTIPHITRAEALDLCNGILYLVESQNKDWM
jgi:putative membrane protein